MKRVALLFSNRAFGNALARAVESIAEEYEVDVISGIPVYSRIEIVRRGSYDLLVADEPIGNGLLAAALSRCLDIPLALVFRGWADLTNEHCEWGPLKDRLITARTRLSLTAANGSFVLSDVTCNRLRSRYPIDGALTVGRPIDRQYYASGTREPPTDGFIVSTVTNLRYEGKFEGVKTILDGLLPVFKQHGSLRYRVAGNGHYLPALRHYVSTFPYSDQVEVLGYRNDIPNLLSGSDLFVYVSYLDSISTAVLEAQAAGLPVIGGDAVGVPTAVGNGGHLCEPTPTGVERAVLDVLEDSTYREELTQRSEARMTEYNERAARQYAGAWDEIIKRRTLTNPLSRLNPLPQASSDHASAVDLASRR